MVGLYMWALRAGDFTNMLVLTAVSYLLIVEAANARQTREVLLTKLVTSEDGESVAKEGSSNSGNSSSETVHIQRDSRGLLNKLSFLAGLKTGSLISSSGTLAASNSLRVFGKVMNTALSVSYGHVDDLDPLPTVQGDQPTKEVRSEGDKLVKLRRTLVSQHNNQVSRLNTKFLKEGGTAPF